MYLCLPQVYFTHPSHGQHFYYKTRSYKTDCNSKLGFTVLSEYEQRENILYLEKMFFQVCTLLEKCNSVRTEWILVRIDSALKILPLLITLHENIEKLKDTNWCYRL